MPQVVAIMIAGAGLYAGFKWVSRLVSQAKDAARNMEEQAERARTAARGPKDLGALEYDQETGVYRPRVR
ncbi:MAG: hypothetical protein WC807_01475 [Hyphomicrobium sp.]